MKAGAIIPMYPEMLYDGEKPKDPVTLDVYPFGKSSFILYEDDGLTQEYRAGAFARTLIEVDGAEGARRAGRADRRQGRRGQGPVHGHARQPIVPRGRARAAQAGDA